MSDSLLPPVAIEIKASAAGALRSISQLIDRLGKLAEAAKAAEAAFGEPMAGIGASAAEMAAKVDASMSAAAESMTALDEKSKTIGASFAAGSDEATAALARLTEAARAAAASMEEVAVASKTSAEKSAASTDLLGSKWLGLGPIFDKVTKWGSIGLAGVGVASVDLAQKFQTQMTRLSTAAGAPIAQVNGMRDAVLKTATSVGVSGTQMAEALYHPVSAGLDLKTSLQDVKYAAMETQISGASLDDTTYALSSVMKAFNQSASDAGPTMAQLNAIVGEGDMRFQDFNESVKNWAPTAAQMGISVTSMGAGLAYLTDRGNSAEVASTRLTMGISMMTTPSGQAARMLEGLGVASSDVTASSAAMQEAMKKANITQNQLALDLKKPDGLYVALKDLKDHLTAAGVSGTEADSVLAKIFGGGRSDKAIMSLMQNLDGVKQKFDAISGDSSMSHFQAAWDKTTKTLKYQFDQIKAGAENLGIKIGDALLPQVSKLISFLESRGAPVVHGFSTALSGIASGFTGQAGKTPKGPHLTGRAARLAEGDGGPAAPPLTGWQKLGEALRGIAGDFRKFGEDCVKAFDNAKKAAGPVLQVFGTALVGALQIIGQILANVVGPALKSFTGFLASNKGLVKDFAEVALGALALKLGAIGSIRAATGITELAGKLLGFPVASVGAISTEFGKLKDAARGVKDAAGGIKSAFAKVPWGSIANGARATWGGLRLGAFGAARGIKDAFSGLGTKIGDGLKAAAGHAGTAWRGIRAGASAAGEAIADFGSKAASGVASVASSAWDGIVGGLQAVGGAAKSAALGLLDLSQKAVASAVAAARSAAAWVAEKVALVASAVAEKAAAAAEWLLNIAMDANPIMLVVLAIAALVAALVYAYNHSKTFREIVQGAFQAVGAVATWLWHSVFEPTFKAIVSIVSACVDWIKGHWPLLLAILGGPIGIAVLLIVKYWGDIKRWFADGVNFVLAAASWLGRLPGMVWGWMESMANKIGNGTMAAVRWFERLPGMILSAIGDLGSLLYNAGMSIMEGLWNGIVSMGAWLGNAIMGLIQSVVPGPVLKILGINSPSKVFHEIGLGVTEGLVNGLHAGASNIAQASATLANVVINRGSPGALALSAAVTGGGGGAYAVPAGAAAMTVPASSSSAPLSGASVVNNIYVQGSVLTERQLRDVVQSQMLQLGARNSQTYQSYRR